LNVKHLIKFQID